jgi:hypothetical protein
MSRMGRKKAKHAEEGRQITDVRIAKGATQEHHQLLGKCRTTDNHQSATSPEITTSKSTTRQKYS